MKAWDGDMSCSKLLVQRGSYIAPVCWIFNYNRSAARDLLSNLISSEDIHTST